MDYKIRLAPGALDILSTCAASSPTSIAHVFSRRKDAPLSPIDAFWHLLNLFAPAIGLGLIAPALAKLLWRHALRPVSWLRLSAWVCASCSLVVIGGLIVFGRDGKMATYAVMTLVCALTLWWLGFASPSRRSSR